MVNVVDPFASKITPRAQQILDEFAELTLLHPALQDVVRRVLRSAEKARKDHMLTVVPGLTGIGKTTMARILTNATIAERPVANNTIPVITVSAQPPQSQSFSMKDLVIALLDATREPLPHAKTNHFPDDELEAIGPTAAARLRALLNALTYRGVRLVIVDEAQHIAEYSTERQARAHLDVLKWLADHSTTPFVLTGTYEVGMFVSLSPQLRRRIREVPFHPYANADSVHLGFAQLLREFSDFLTERNALAAGLDLLQKQVELSAGSIGCVGHLKDWVARALEAAFYEGRRVVAWSDFVATGLDGDDLNELRQHAALSAKAFQGQRADLRQYLTSRRRAARKATIARQKPFHATPRRVEAGSFHRSKRA
jgi:hypothetical protein